MSNFCPARGEGDAIRDGRRLQRAQGARLLAVGVRRAYDPTGTTRQLLAIIAAPDRRPQLKRIAAPTLVIHGVQDPLVPIEVGRETASATPTARLMAIDGMGHDLPRALWPILINAIAKHCRAAEG